MGAFVMLIRCVVTLLILCFVWFCWLGVGVDDCVDIDAVEYLADRGWQGVVIAWECGNSVWWLGEAVDVDWFAVGSSVASVVEDSYLQAVDACRGDVGEIDPLLGFAVCSWWWCLDDRCDGLGGRCGVWRDEDGADNGLSGGTNRRGDDVNTPPRALHNNRPESVEPIAVAELGQV